MPLSPLRIRQRLLPYSYLTPFAALVLYGVAVLWGWKTGELGLVQPRSYDAALPANAGVCLILLGLAANANVPEPVAATDLRMKGSVP